MQVRPPSFASERIRAAVTRHWRCNVLYLVCGGYHGSGIAKFRPLFSLHDGFASRNEAEARAVVACGGSAGESIGGPAAGGIGTGAGLNAATVPAPTDLRVEIKTASTPTPQKPNVAQKKL